MGKPRVIDLLRDSAAVAAGRNTSRSRTCATGRSSAFKRRLRSARCSTPTFTRTSATATRHGSLLQKQFFRRWGSLPYVAYVFGGHAWSVRPSGTQRRPATVNFRTLAGGSLVEGIHLLLHWPALALAQSYRHTNNTREREGGG